MLIGFKEMLTGNFSADILGFETERAISGLVAESVGSIVVNLVDVLQNGNNRLGRGGDVGFQSSSSLLAASLLRKSDDAGDEEGGSLQLQ